MGTINGHQFKIDSKPISTEITHSLKMVPNRFLSDNVNPGCPQSWKKPYNQIIKIIIIIIKEEEDEQIHNLSYRKEAYYDTIFKSQAAC